MKGRKKGYTTQKKNEHFIPQSWSSLGISFLFLSWASSLIVLTTYLPFSPPQGNKQTQSTWRIGNAQQQKSHSSALPLFSLSGAVWDFWWSSGLSCVRWMTDANSISSMKDTDHVGQGKATLQLRTDLKDSSRLKLIEIPFVAFDDTHPCQIPSPPLTPSPQPKYPNCEPIVPSK